MNNKMTKAEMLKEHYAYRGVFHVTFNWVIIKPKGTPVCGRTRSVKTLVADLQEYNKRGEYVTAYVTAKLRGLLVVGDLEPMEITRDDLEMVQNSLDMYLK